MLGYHSAILSNVYHNIFYKSITVMLLEHHGTSCYWHLNWLFISLFWLTRNITPKIHITGYLCSAQVHWLINSGIPSALKLMSCWKGCCTNLTQGPFNLSLMTLFLKCCENSFWFCAWHLDNFGMIIDHVTIVYMSGTKSNWIFTGFQK